MATALESASLVMIPSGYEDGTLGSLQPLDGTGDFTFSRGSNLSATRVKQDGYIEKGYENLLLQSNQFDTIWASVRVGESTGFAGYDGTSDAWKIVPNAQLNDHRLDQSTSVSGVWTFSIYAKAAGYNFLYILFSGIGNSGKIIDISPNQGVVVDNKGGVQAIDESITDVGNDWWKITLTYSGTLGTLRIITLPANDTSSYAGDGTSGILIQDVQVNQGLIAYPYLETAATSAKGGILENTPRIDYTGVGAGSLLLEPSRTNLMVHSEYITGTQGTSTFNAITSPEGVNNGLLFVENTATTTHGFLRGATIPTNANAVDYTISIFAKKKEREYIQFTFYADGTSINSSGFNLINGTTSGDPATHKIEDYGNGWYRCSFTASVLQSTGAYNFSRVQTGINESSFYYQGDGTSGMYFYGWQVEQNATYPTSYIPTYGTSQTRAEDVCEDAGNVSSIVNSPEGTFFTEFAKVNDFNGVLLSDGTPNNRITLYPRNNTTQITFIFTIGGVQIIRQDPSPSGLDTTRFNKYAIAWGLNDFRVYINGVNIYTSTSNITFSSGTINNIDLDSAKHKQALVFNQALSDEALIELTTI